MADPRPTPRDPRLAPPCDHPHCDAESLVAINGRALCQPHIEWGMHEALAPARVALAAMREQHPEPRP